MCGSGRQKLPPHQIEIQANVNDSNSNNNNNVERDSDSDVDSDSERDSERDARRLKAKPKIHINNATSSSSDGRRSSSSLCALPCTVPLVPGLPATCHMPQLCVCPWQKPFGLFLRMAGATQSTPPPPLQASPGKSAGSPQLSPPPPLLAPPNASCQKSPALSFNSDSKSNSNCDCPLIWSKLLVKLLECRKLRKLHAACCMLHATAADWKLPPAQVGIKDQRS